MKAKENKQGESSESTMVKAFFIAFISLILLIPAWMIMNLIEERQERSWETVSRINDKWSQSQTITGPVLCLPYTVRQKDDKGNIVYRDYVLHLAPHELNVDTELFPEERYYGIYKTILYRSEVSLKGTFDISNVAQGEMITFHYGKSYIDLGISDLKGIANNIHFNLGGKEYIADMGGDYGNSIGNTMRIELKNNTLTQQDKFDFDCTFQLKGSSSFNIVPIGKTTTATISGAWQNPGFIGDFTPDYDIDSTGFKATWGVLSINRPIPDRWIHDNDIKGLRAYSFGVNLVEPVDHYQQNMRSAKYAIMFIALTFTVFFFVELITRKKIHLMQYLLVGLALVLFYTLLLSISEHTGFTIAYLIASIAIIGMISLYSLSLFKSRKQSVMLGLLLTGLYGFLYVILMAEDVSLLLGSIGLFIILGVIMYFSRKITWYTNTDNINHDILNTGTQSHEEKL